MAQAQSTRARLAIPIHGILGAYPLVCFTAALITDLAYADTAEMQWANFSVWLIAGGVAMGVIAAIAGVVDAMVTRARRQARSWHSVLTIIMLITAIINGFIHSRDAWTSVVPSGLVLSVITSILALVTSWLGYSAAALPRTEAA
ncbi:DUF2231 domain-containing protein [Sphingomonas sp.]|uniref:DUF2231 domain-containing protein n=1 Tax=Sphingomonas sp. TaxID=28214 RepID=UPI002E31D5D0|nr:DUF2231 domain-containing protein [Sphingomonas sp.]HEX4695202.1 DUF2231 domain-containing protein [Sphingomonas sp.]